MTTVYLDSEAISALLDPRSRKRTEVLAVLEAVVLRRRRGVGADVVAPTTARVEARWSRTDPRASAVNRLPIRDAPLDGPTANLASTIAATTGVSVADAHVGALVQECEGESIVVTSDPRDIERASAPVRVRVIRL